MRTNVRGYKDKELLDKVKRLPNFYYIPKDYWILGVQSNEDEFNVFDDKFYIFKGEKFIMVTSGTTNSGEYGLKRFFEYNSKGTFIIETNRWFYGLWKNGIHKGKMKALVQNTEITGFRDNNKNNKAEETGKEVRGFFGINFHTVSYNKITNFILKFIGRWGTGCQIVNNVDDYYKIINLVKNQRTVTYCIIKEF